MSGFLSRKAEDKMKAEADAKAREEAEATAKAEAEAKAAAEAEEQARIDAEAKAKADAEAAKKAEAEATAKAATEPADPAIVARLCAEKDAADKAEGLIKRKATLAEVEAALDSAADIRALCAAAHRINPAIDANAMAADFERGKASAAHAGKVLLEKLADMQSPEIANRHSAAPAAASGHVQAGNHGWDQAIEKVSNQFKPPQAPTH